MDVEEICPICGTSSRANEVGGTGGNDTFFECPRCGPYQIGKVARLKLSSGAPDWLLSGWVRHQHELGNNPPRIAKENLPGLLSQLPHFSTSSKTRELLGAIARMTSRPGKSCALTPDDASLAWAADSDELEFHLGSLIENGWLSRIAHTIDGHSEVLLTPRGWEVLELGRDFKVARAFVAMSFSKSMYNVWADGLRPGIESAGYEAHRVDTEPHIGRIDLKIQGDIRDSKFVVADATEQKQGVYYEAGFAEGLGKPVIWTVRANEIGQVHFDTRQYAHILWDEPADLATKLEGVIVGVLGRGPRLKD